MRNSHPLITIGIPTYNRADTYFPLTLGSALRQTYSEIEVIVSDNASSDHTPEVVLGNGDPRIRYFRHAEKIEPQDNWNYLLRHAKGDYFLLLHDDDLIDCDFIEVCMNASEQSSFGVIRTGTRVIDGEGLIRWEGRNRVKGLPLDEFFRAWFGGKTAFYFVGTLFETEALREIGGFHSKNRLVQDIVAIALLASRRGRVDIEAVKASYRKHPAALTFASTVTRWGEDFLYVLDLLCELTPPSKRAGLRREGMRFFSGLTLDRATGICSRVERVRAYRQILRLFPCEYFPLGRLVGIDSLRKKTRYAKRKLVHFVRRGQSTTEKNMH